MTSRVPPAYHVYRGLWSALHFALLLWVAFLLGSWWFTDANGGDLVAGWWAWSSGVQQALWNWIPFPWDAWS